MIDDTPYFFSSCLRPATPCQSLPVCLFVCQTEIFISEAMHSRCPSPPPPRGVPARPLSACVPMGAGLARPMPDGPTTSSREILQADSARCNSMTDQRISMCILAHVYAHRLSAKAPCFSPRGNLIRLWNQASELTQHRPPRGARSRATAASERSR